MRGVALVVFCLVVAGCLGAPAEEPVEPTPSSTTTTPPPANTTPPPAPVPALTPVALRATDCYSLSWLHIDEFTAMDPLLPPGFVPADAASLLKLQDTIKFGQGAMGPVTAVCAANDLSGGPLALSLPGVLVESPSLPVSLAPTWLEGYEAFVAISDPVVADLFEAFGWTVQRNSTIDIEVFANEEPPNVGVSRIPEVRSFGATLSADGNVEATVAAAGGSRYHTFDPEGSTNIIRFWHDTPRGLSYIDNVVSEHGTSGAADCEYPPGSAYGATFGRSECTAGESVAVMLHSFDLETTIYLLEGVHA